MQCDCRECKLADAEQEVLKAAEEWAKAPTSDMSKPMHPTEERLARAVLHYRFVKRNG